MGVFSGGHLSLVTFPLYHDMGPSLETFSVLTPQNVSTRYSQIHRGNVRRG